MKFESHGKKFALWDVLHSIAIQRTIAHYLEVGVCYGHSLQTVLENQHPGRLTLCDSWGGESGGESFGGPTHIEALLQTMEYKHPVVFLNGNSHELLKTLPKRSFDLITVDGDHTPDGAREDLMDCWTLLQPGGLLVFDDLSHPAHPELLSVFQDFTQGIYATLIHQDLNTPMGVAVLCKT